MNIKYHRWFEMEIRHDYFSKGVIPNISLLPTAATGSRMHQLDVLMRSNGNKFSFYLGLDASKEFDPTTDLAHLGLLNFHVLTDDPLFVNYTTLTFSGSNSLLQLGTGLNQSNGNALQRGDVVNNDDMMRFRNNRFIYKVEEGTSAVSIRNMKDEIVFELDVVPGVSELPIALSGSMDGPLRLFADDEEKESFMVLQDGGRENALGILSIDASSVSESPTPLDYTIDFKVREVFFKYRIVIPESRNMEVVSIEVLDAGESYTGPSEGLLMGTQKTLDFESKTTKPLQNRAEVFPLLKMEYTGSAGGNVTEHLELQLPNPTPESISMYQQGENAGAYFATTIVYV